MKKHYMGAAVAALALSTSAFALGQESYTGSIGMTGAGFCPAGTVEANGQLLNIQQYAALASLYGITYGGDGRTTFGVPDLRGRTPVGYGQSAGTSYVAFGKPRGQESVTLTAANLPAHIHPFTATTGSQNVTIPATTGSGTTLSGTVGVVAAQGNTGSDFTPVAGQTYQLAGASVNGTGAMVGPYSDTNPSASAKISGVNVDASGMTPNIPAKTVTIQTVTGGVVGANTTPNYPVVTVPPQLGIRYCIVYDGIYPPRP